MTAGEPLRGVGVSPGVRVGPVRSLVGQVPEPPEGERHRGDAASELVRARAALDAVAADLETHADKADGEAREMLAAQAMMARDPAVADIAERRIAEGVTAARAAYEAFGVFRETLAGAGGYVAARVSDLDAVRDRVLALIQNLPIPGVPVSGEPFVLVARDLSPADTALLDPAKILAFVTEEGGPTSHTAILARAAGVPAVVACEGCMSLSDGTTVRVDGSTGQVLPDPPAQERASASGAVRALAASGPGKTADGHAVPLLANIGGPGDVGAAVANGAEGVGLYRTEFLFLGRATPPSAEEQVAAYRAVLTAFSRVVVRVLDAGSDKPLGFLPPAGAEPNPALGVRGLRLLRRHPGVLRTQLRALAQAASGLDVRVAAMAPMVTSVEEARGFVAACRDAGLARAGVMIEVPAAAMRARDLAAEVDFFSVGTNDLAQYAFAADREVGSLSGLQDPWQPALLDLAAFAASAASAAGKPCGVCGEAAADPALACVFAGLGVTSLSMSPYALPAVRAALAAHSLEQCRRAADAARGAPDAEAAVRAAHAELGR